MHGFSTIRPDIHKPHRKWEMVIFFDCVMSEAIIQIPVLQAGIFLNNLLPPNKVLPL